MNANLTDYFNLNNLPHCIISVGFIVMVHTTGECRPLLNPNNLAANIHKPQPDETIKQLTNHFNPWQDCKPDITWFYLFIAFFLKHNYCFQPDQPVTLIFKLNGILQQLGPVKLLTFSRSVLFKLLREISSLLKSNDKLLLRLW